MVAYRMPAGLTSKGRGQRLWKDITTKWELTEAEYRLLESACYTADRIVKERRIIGDQLTVRGSQGQMVAHPLLSELRRDEKHMVDLLNGIDMPEEKPEAQSQDGERSAAMRAVVNSRWNKTYGA